ncbi:chorismate mutase aro7 [Ceratobasidium sp. 428]|nr:chorismate mutase aro7 [Ceratobasidium sp. 428]
MTQASGNSEEGRTMLDAVTRSRESSVLISGTHNGFTSQPPSSAIFSHKRSLVHSAVNQNIQFTPLHFSHIRQASVFQHKLLMPSTQSNYMSPVDPLSLNRIRSNLIRLEDTIIFSLIERAQFALNPRIYERDCFDELRAMKWRGSWLEWFMKETETFHGKFVSESKFRAHPADFIPHILNPNPDALLKLITKPEVEAALLERVKRKASIYGQELSPGGEPVLNTMGAARSKIDVEGVRDLYETWIIPLTKEVEVEYLLHRLDGLSQEEIDELMKSG